LKYEKFTDDRRQTWTFGPGELKNEEKFVSKDIHQKNPKKYWYPRIFTKKPRTIGIQGYQPETKKNLYPRISTKTRKN
jgi:hypothetical protein